MANTPSLIAGTNILTGNAASVAIPAWSNCLYGDQKFLAITVTSDPSATLPSGWVLLIDIAIGTSNTLRRLYVFSQIAAGADAGFTQSFSGATNYGVTPFAIRDAEYITPENISRYIAAVTGESGTALATPSINCEANSLFIGHFCTATTGTAAVPTLPAGMTDVDSQAPISSAGHSTRIAQESRAAAGAVTRTSTGPVSNRWTATGFHFAGRARNRHFFGT